MQGFLDSATGLFQSRRVCHPEAARLLSGVLRPKDPRSREQRPLRFAQGRLFGGTLRVTDPARLGLSSDYGKALDSATVYSPPFHEFVIIAQFPVLVAEIKLDG